MNKTYKLHIDLNTKMAMPYVEVLIDGVANGEWAHLTENQEYLAWLEQGNTPLPADEGTQ